MEWKMSRQKGQPVKRCFSRRSSSFGKLHSSLCQYFSASEFDESFSVLLDALEMSSGDLIFRISLLNHISVKPRLHSQRGAAKMTCMVSNCDFTSVIDCTLNHRSIADPDPWLFSRAFSRHIEKLSSMTLTKLPCPALVMHFVMHSIKESFVSVA